MGDVLQYMTAEVSNILGEKYLLQHELYGSIFIGDLNFISSYLLSFIIKAVRNWLRH